jgi:phosphatidylinositol alpha 1,6-mannosyltransferase
MSRLSGGHGPRVLFCTDTYPPQVNGVSVVTGLSVSGLERRGWECAVVAPKYPRAMSNPFRRLRVGGTVDDLTSVASVPLPGYADIRLAAPRYDAIARVIDRFEPDLVHCQTEFVLGRLGQIAAKRAGVATVSSYHTDFSRYVAAYGLPWLRGAVSAYIGRFHRRSARVYTPSGPARDDLCGLGVRDVEVWGRGVDAHAFHPRYRGSATRKGFGFADRFVFLHVGRLAAEKGVERILEAYASARALLPAGTIHLVIAGSGPAEAMLRASAPPEVTFLGFLDRETALPSLYANCDAFLFSSLTETLGLVVLEAMASGLPVIATLAGGVADHLRHLENGIAYPANDTDAMAHAMVDLVMRRDLRATLAAGARRTAEALSWERELDRLDVSYREVCVAARKEGHWAASRAGRRRTTSRRAAAV